LVETQRPTPAPDGRTPPSLAAAWRAAVADILRFQDFAAALQLRNFLEYIVEETLAGRGDQLKERNIAVHALSRDSDFDSRLDCVVRVMACKLRRALERYYHGPGAQAEWRIEVPRGGYRPLFERADERGDPARSTPALPGRGASGAAADGDLRHVLAVLPLWPLTSGPEELALAEAVACETCVKLRKFRWLEVLDYLVTRCWHQDNGGQPDQEQAQRCDHLIDGTCRRLGGQVRLTVQLTSVADGHLHWAEQFDLACASSDFAKEDAVVAGICRGVAAALHGHCPRRAPAGAADQPRRARNQPWRPAPSPTVFPESERQPVAAPKH
jgi:TolB-like protein